MEDNSPKVGKGTFMRRTNRGMKGTMTEIMVAEGRLNGMSQSQIAEHVSKKLGKEIKRRTVSEILSREHVKEIMESQYNRIVKEALPVSTDNIISAVKSFKDKNISAEDKKIAWDATKEVAKSIGTIASTNQSVVHATFIAQQNNVVIPPVIADLMAKHYGGIIDITATRKEIEDECENREEG